MGHPNIVLECERMRHPNTGLYHYCWHLGQTIPRLLPRQYRMQLYLPPQAAALAAGRPFLTQRPWHRLYQQAARGVQLWHCTNQDSAYFPAAADCRILLTVHDLNFLYGNKPAAKQARYLSRLQAKVTRADHIVAISRYVKDDLLRHTDVDAGKISVIYNGCNINEGVVPQPPAQLPPASFLFTVGTIVDKKNFHVLPGLLQGNSYHLVIAGIVQSESYRARIVAAAAALGVADRIHFTGAITEAEKYWYLQHCAAFAFPSLSEGFGLPVIEAMYFGKPTLLSRATSLPEVGGSEAFYFDSFAPEHMSALAQQAIAAVDAHRSAAISAWARRFSWEAAALGYIDCYRQLLS